MSTLVEVLPRLLLPDNAVRHAAEHVFHQMMKDDCENTLVALFQIMVDSERVPSAIRKLTAVLLRRILVGSEESAYFKLSPSTQQTLLSELVRVLKVEKQESLRFLIGEIAGELGGILDSSDWPALPITALTLCKSNDGMDRMVGLTLIGYLADPQLSSASADAFLTEALTVLAANFQAPFSSSTKLLIHNVKALNYFLQATRSASQSDRLAALVPLVMQTLSQVLQAKIAALDADEELDTDDDEVKAYLEEVIDIADHSVHFFAANYGCFLGALLAALEDWHVVLSVNLKALLIEFLVTLCVGNPKAIKKFKGGPNEPPQKYAFFHKLLPYLAELMTHFEEDPNWEKDVSIEEMNNDEIHFVAEAALQRCLVAAGVTATHNLVMRLVGEHLSAAQGQSAVDPADPEASCHAIAALQIVGSYMEVSHTMEQPATLQAHRQEVLAMLSQYIALEAMPRVRYSAYYALGQFIVFHAEALPQEVVGQILATLLTHANAAGTGVQAAPRVMRALLLCIVNLFEVCSASLWTKDHLIQTLQAVAPLLGPAVSNIVQELALTLLVTLLETTRSYPLHAAWKELYGPLMPACKHLLYAMQNPAYLADIAHSPQVDVYHGLLDAISLLGEAAGTELFMQDAREVMTVLHNSTGRKSRKETAAVPTAGAGAFTVDSGRAGGVETEGTAGEDLGGVKAYVRIARCLGADFAPFLSTTMHKIAAALSQDIVVPNRSGPDGSDPTDELDLDDDDQDVDMIESADGLVAVRTSLIEEQVTALQCLLLVLGNAEMLDDFVPYFEYTLGVVQRCASSVHEDIRAHTLVLLPELVRFITALHAKRSGPGPQGQAPQLLMHIRVEDVLTGALQACLHVLEAESAVELVITALQVLRQIVLYACMDGAGAGTGFVPRLSQEQLAVLAQNIKIVLRDSLQRRAVHKAEAQVARGSGGQGRAGYGPATGCGDDDDDEGVEDVDEEALLAAQSLELHYHVSEALSALLQTHSFLFFAAYRDHWHDLVLTLSHTYCVREDRRLAMMVTCDVLQFAFQSAAQAVDGHAELERYLVAVFPQILALVGAGAGEGEEVDWESRRAACFALSVLFDQFGAFVVSRNGEHMSVQWVARALGALRECTVLAHSTAAKDEADAEAKGCCLDNAIAAVGAILEQSLCAPFDLPLPFAQLFQQYIMSWPLRNDVEEGDKCVARLHRMLQQHGLVMWAVLSAHPQAMVLTVNALVHMAAVGAEHQLADCQLRCQSLLVELTSSADAHTRSGMTAQTVDSLRKEVWAALDVPSREAVQQVLSAQVSAAAASQVTDIHWRR